MKPGADTSRLGRWRLPAQKHLIVTPELPVTQSASVQRDANAQSVLFLSRPQIKAASPRRRRWRDPERRSGLTAGLVKTPLGRSKQQQSEDRRVPERVTQLCTHTCLLFYLCEDAPWHDALLKPRFFPNNDSFTHQSVFSSTLLNQEVKGQNTPWTGLITGHTHTHIRIV